MTLLRNGKWTNEDSIESINVVDLQDYLTMTPDQKAQVRGVSVNPEDDVKALSGHLDALQVIVINFPKYTDGRGYSHARILRSQLGFSREIRASGDIRPDQLLFMIRSGINTFAFPAKQNEKLVEQILTRYEKNYQPSYALPMAG